MTACRLDQLEDCLGRQDGLFQCYACQRFIHTRVGTLRVRSAREKNKYIEFTHNNKLITWQRPSYLTLDKQLVTCKGRLVRGQDKSNIGFQPIGSFIAEYVCDKRSHTYCFCPHSLYVCDLFLILDFLKAHFREVGIKHVGLYPFFEGHSRVWQIFFDDLEKEGLPRELSLCEGHQYHWLFGTWQIVGPPNYRPVGSCTIWSLSASGKQGFCSSNEGKGVTGLGSFEEEVIKGALGPPEPDASVILPKAQRGGDAYYTTRKQNKL